MPAKRLEIVTDAAGIVLRPFLPQDGPALVRHANNRNVSRNLRDAFPFPYTPADAENWLAHANDDGLERSFAITGDGAVIGGIGLKREFDVNRLSNEIGYWLGEEYWGRGIATAAVVALTSWAFHELEIVRIWGGVFSSNRPSCRVLEKAGYRYEGTLRSSIFKDGVIYDQLVYARLRSDSDDDPEAART